ncbi:hypothetical protein XENTR_v10015694 [Xenopus tropicalis]|uniref:Gastrula zinc finger protein xFG20-1 isoform X2 n=1 Tax=Xenopus tropicalis TaxID=8364 RepID=A0A803JXQ0_XENTR|nr:gastrula zinc finger protein xFG20-1 isoform X2 [Xenopus tropicalis]KAE8595313.1 hypothetical protein XENTR_v10015694 [Xenopus tropicalis]
MSRTLPVQMHLTYSDLAVYFSEEEWKDLEGWQKEMYKEVMKDNYENLRSLGIQVPKPDVFLKFRRGKKEVGEAIPCNTGSTKEKQIEPKLQPIILQQQDLITDSKEGTPEGKSPQCLKCGNLEDCNCYIFKCNAKRPYSCIDCGKSYRKHSLLIVHQKSHFKGQAYKCECCEKSFIKPSHLQRHVKTHREYKCPECEECFRNISLFYKHVKLQHKGRGYKCHTCLEVFPLRSDIMKHQESHKTVHQCGQCKAVYTRLGSFKKHMSTHLPQIATSQSTSNSENGEIQKFLQITTSHSMPSSENGKTQEFPQTTTSQSTFSSVNENTQTVPQTTTNHGKYSEHGNTQTFPQTTTSHGTFRSENRKNRKFPQTTVNHGSFSSENGNTQTFPQTTISHGTFRSENRKNRKCPKTAVSHGGFSSDNGNIQTFPQTTTIHGGFSPENGNTQTFPQTTTSHGTFRSENRKKRKFPQTAVSHGGFSSDNGNFQTFPQATTIHGGFSPENGNTQTFPQTAVSHGTLSSESGNTQTFPQTTTSHGTFSSKNTKKFLHQEERDQNKMDRSGHPLISDHAHELKQNKPIKKETVKRKVDRFSSDRPFVDFQTKAKTHRQANVSEDLLQRLQSQRPKTTKNTKHQVTQNTTMNLIAPHKVELIPQPTAPTSNNKSLTSQSSTYLEKAEEDLFTCKKCKKRYRHRTSLLRHKKSHTQRYTCHACGETFPKLVLVYLHRMVHTGKKRHACRFCQKRFSVRSLLLLHRKTHKIWEPDLLLNIGQGNLLEIQQRAMEHEVHVDLKENRFLMEHSYHCTPASGSGCRATGPRPALQEARKCRDYVKKIRYRNYEPRDSN